MLRIYKAKPRNHSDNSACVHLPLPAQSLVRIPETLVCAMEFINLATPPDHLNAMEEVRKSIVRAFPDLKDKKLFWSRKPSIVKVC